MRSFTVIIEQDEDGYYVGSVPGLQGCHSQGKTLDELMANMKEAIKLCLEENEDHTSQFIGIQQIQI